VGELTSTVTGKLVAFDTAPLVYYLEEHPQYVLLANELFEALDRGIARGISSVLTLAEVLVKRLRDGQPDLAEAYRRHLTDAAGVVLLPVTDKICECAAKLRAKYDWLRTPAALQVATAVVHDADCVVTNDQRWNRVTELPVVILRDYLGRV